MRHSSRASWTDGLACAVWLVLLVQCRQNPTDFYGKVYYCDANAVPSDCGTNQAGQPLMCMPASQLGAKDFCTDVCTADEQASPPAGAVCLDSGAKLQTCHPSQDQPGAGGACGDPALRCLRTDLLKDEGVCTTVDICATNVDCKSPSRMFCAGELLGYIYGDSAGFMTDHLYCLQAGCRQTGSSCQTGESCLPDVVHAQSEPPDICVPNCDKDLNCPPNYACYTKVSGPANYPACIPGLLGFRCSGQMDCMVGDCVDTGEGLSLCTLPCSSDQDCAQDNNERSRMLCVSFQPGQPGHCAALSTFQGAACRPDKGDADCQPGEICTLYSPYGTQLDTGSCLVPCGPAGECPARGGFAHSCLDYLPTPVCYPGDLGIHCRADTDCLRSLKCLPVTDVDQNNDVVTSMECSLPCTDDSTCAADLLGSVGWCYQGNCILKRAGSRLCTADTQCMSGKCQDGLCTIPPGGA